MPRPQVDQLVDIEWQSPSAELFAQAEENGQLIVLYFAGSDDNDEEFLKQVDIGQDVLDGEVICVRVEAREDEALTNEFVGEHASGVTTIELLATDKTPRIEQADLWEAYDIEDARTFVIADHFGNPLFTTDAPELSGLLFFTDRAVSRIFEAMHEHLPKAEKLIEEEQFGPAMIELKMFLPDRWVGYEEITQAQALYDKLYDEGMVTIDKAEGDLEKLEALVTLYKGSELQDYAELVLDLSVPVERSDNNLPEEAEAPETESIENEIFKEEVVADNRKGTGERSAPGEHLLNE